KEDVKILLIEDNEGDIVLTLQALKEAKVVNVVYVVKDGEEALKYLRKEGSYNDEETPGLILLDINLPRLDGIAVLAEIKNDAAFMTIPVVMLTTSNAEKDIMESYRHHANCYITKPVDYQKFMDVVLAIKDFWINIVKLPEH
ncbi:MAG TPA: response regulator, partial [Chitinophagaceae bacterium]|nr:response regulator [Chitinophagaceae bacterium]